MLGLGHTATKALKILPCPHDKVRTTDPINISIKLGCYIPLVMLLNWLNFGGILLETFMPNYWKFWTSWRETERNCIEWVLGHLCYLDLWPQPWPWPRIFKVKCWNKHILNASSNWHGMLNLLCDLDLIHNLDFEFLDIEVKILKWLYGWSV